MPALYVYSFLLPGCKLLRAHAEPPHLKDVETGEESIYTVFKAFTLDGRYLATYAAQKAPSPSAANGLVYYVPGAVVWKGLGNAATDFSPSTYGVVAGW